MALINIKPCGDSSASIFNNAGLDRLHHDKHCNRCKLCTQILNAIHGKAVLLIHVCMVVEDIKGTLYKKLQAQCQFLCFHLRLCL